MVSTINIRVISYIGLPNHTHACHKRKQHKLTVVIKAKYVVLLCHCAKTFMPSSDTFYAKLHGNRPIEQRRPKSLLYALLSVRCNGNTETKIEQWNGKTNNNSRYSNLILIPVPQIANFR